MTTVRPAVAQDAESISRIAAAVQTIHADQLPEVFQPASSSSLPATDVLALFATPDRHLWVCVDGDEIVGYLAAETQRRPSTSIKRPIARLYVHQMGVLPQAQRHGIGTALLDAAHRFASDAGLHEIALDVWRFNEAARAFYAASGFAIMREELWCPVQTPR